MDAPVYSGGCVAIDVCRHGIGTWAEWAESRKNDHPPAYIGIFTPYLLLLLALLAVIDAFVDFRTRARRTSRRDNGTSNLA